MIDFLRDVVANIAAVIGGLATIYKLGLNNNRSRTQKYYKSILKPFMVAYKKDKSISSVKYIKKNAKRKSDNIPKYIFYLAEKDEEEELKKVLLYDYLDLYNNNSYIINQFAKVVYKVVVYFIVFLSYFSLFLCGFFLSRMMLIIFDRLYYIVKSKIKLQEILKMDIDFLWQYIVIEILFFSMYVLCLYIAEFINIDRYTLKERAIKRMIKSKVDKYDKKNSKFVL